jgi:hypothetical protein
MSGDSNLVITELLTKSGDFLLYTRENIFRGLVEAFVYFASSAVRIRCKNCIKVSNPIRDTAGSSEDNVNCLVRGAITNIAVSIICFIVNCVRRYEPCRCALVIPSLFTTLNICIFRGKKNRCNK